MNKTISKRTKDFIIMLVSATLSIVLTKKLIPKFPYSGGAIKLFIGFIAVSFRDEILKGYQWAICKATGKPHELHSDSATPI